MAVEWTEHRFSGGVLALDVTNTVVLRDDPLRCFDRFDDSQEIARFATAVSHYRSDELGGQVLGCDEPEAIRKIVIDIREATDALFRAAASGHEFGGVEFGRFLRACAAGAERNGVVPGPACAAARGSVPFEAALAVSALSLLRPEMTRRMKICANCGWLFVDRSRNSSRMWCDMKVCGNRQKARRHYNRHRNGNNGHDHA